MSVRAVFAACAQPGPSRRDPFRDRSPAGARPRGESALEVHSKTFARISSRNASPSPAKSQCRPSSRQLLRSASRAAGGQVFAGSRWETKARRWDPSSYDTSHSSVRSLCRSPGKPPDPLRPDPVRVSPYAGILRVDAAPRGPLAAGCRSFRDRAPSPLGGHPERSSSLLDFFSSFFPGLSRRRSRFAVCGISAALRLSYIILFIGANDLLHQVVPHHVLLAKLYHADSVDLPAHFQRLNQAGLLSLRQVDLCNVAGDHRFGVEAQPRQEHFHLLARGVLRFVQNHKRIIQRPSTHERQRRDFYNSLFKKAFQFVRVQHVVQGVVKWPHVRIDFLLQRARQKSQPLTRFHRGARQDDAVYLLGKQRAHGHGYGDVGLPGSAGADAEHHVVLLDLFHVAFLTGVLRRDLLFAEGAHTPVFKHPSWRFVRLLRRHAHQRLHLRRRKRFAVPRQVVVLLTDFHRLVDTVLLAFDGQPRVVQVRAHAQRVFEQAHVFIERAKEGFNLSGDVNGTSHPIGRSSCYGNRVADGIPPVVAWPLREPLTEKLFYTLTHHSVAVKLRLHNICGFMASKLRSLHPH